MTPEEIKTQLDEVLSDSQKTINRWHSHAGITPEINKELSHIASMIPAITFIMFGTYSPEFINIAKCVVEATFQYGRRFPLIDWTVVEETKNETTN